MKTKLRTLARSLSEFHGRMAKKAEGRGWKTLTFIATSVILVAVFAGEWKAVLQELPSPKGSENLYKLVPGFPYGTEVTVIRESEFKGFLVRANGQEAWINPGWHALFVSPLPDGGYKTPEVRKTDGSLYSHEELYQLWRWLWVDRNDATDRVPREAGHPFVPLPKKAGQGPNESWPWKTLTTATLLKWKAPANEIIAGHKFDYRGRGKDRKVFALEIGDDYVITTMGTVSPMVGKFPKEAFLEFGGTDKKEIEVASWNWPPTIPKPLNWEEKMAEREAKERKNLMTAYMGEAAPSPVAPSKKTRFDRIFPYSPKTEFTLARDIVIQPTREGEVLKVPAGTKIRILFSYEFEPQSFEQRINQGVRSGIVRHLILVGESREQVIVPASAIAEHGGKPGETLNVRSIQPPTERSLFRKDGPEGFIWTGAPTGDENVPSSYPEGEKAMLEKINALRRSKGILPLKWNEDLARAARYQAGDCYVQGYDMGHEVRDKVNNNGTWGTTNVEVETVGALRFSPLAKGANWVGGWDSENKTPKSVERAFQGWMKSPGHYELMINPNCTTVGIGNVGSMWVTTFGD